MKPANRPLLASSALLTAALLTGCSYFGGNPKEPVVHQPMEAPDGVESRQVALMPYHAQGITVAGTTNWYYGETPGLRAYAVKGGIVYVEGDGDEGRSSKAKQAPSDAPDGSWDRAAPLDDLAPHEGKPDTRLEAAMGKTQCLADVDAGEDTWTLLGRFSFPFASADDLYEYSEDRLAILLDGEAPAERLHIVGYTDDIGTDEVNLPLSSARAESIAERLRDRWPDTAITTEGRGNCPRIMSNTEPGGRAANRRVEVYALEDE